MTKEYVNDDGVLISPASEAAKKAYQRAKAILDEARRQGRHGEQLSGEPLKYASKVPMIQQAYDRELQYGGRYFVDGKFLARGLPPHVRARGAQPSINTDTPYGDSTANTP